MIKKKIQILSAHLVIFLVCACGHAQVQTSFPVNRTSNSLFWRVSGNGLTSPTYLYGTFHLMCKDDINIGANARHAIEGADEVYFELDMDDPSTLLGGVFIMNMQGKQTLKDLYTKDEYEFVLHFLKDSLGIPAMMAERLKPALTESFIYPKLLACKTMSGVDETLVKIASSAKKEIKGLETVKEQGAVFDSIPYSVQAKSLYETLTHFIAYKGDFAKMVAAYRRQELDTLNLASGADTLMDKYNYLLLDKRNVKWVAELKTLMPQKALFVAVGAGHLPGKMGLINLLREQGYKVEPIENK